MAGTGSGRRWKRAVIVAAVAGVVAGVAWKAWLMVIGARLDRE